MHNWDFSDGNEGDIDQIFAGTPDSFGYKIAGPTLVVGGHWC